jgi:hypothetical protein
MSKRPKLFIGSSVEGLDIAYAIQTNLEHEAEITVWTQGVFNLSSTAMHDLISETEKSDFAVFVFSPDDMSIIRLHEYKTIRDNVLFEFGLFIGRLGLDRVFYVMPRGQSDLHIATDLAGITPGTYDPNRTDGRWEAALGPICNEIRKKVRQKGEIASNQINPELEERIKSLESHARFLFFLIQLSRHSKIKYNQVLSAFWNEFQMMPLMSKKAITLFRLTKEKDALEQIGCAGVVNDENIRFYLDHNEKHPERCLAVDAYNSKGYAVAATLKHFGNQDEYLFSRIIADSFVINIHFLTNRHLPQQVFETLDIDLYNINKDIFDSFNVFLKGEMHDETT